MTRRKNIVLAAAMIGMLGCLVAVAQAEIVVEYKLTANGLETGSGAGGAITPGDLGLGAGGGEFTLGIEVMVTGAEFSGQPLGILQYSASIAETGAAMEPVQTMVFGMPQGTWASSSTAPLVNYKGDVGDPDILGQTGQVPPGDFGTHLQTLAAAVWDAVGSGPVVWDGSATQYDLTSSVSSNIVGFFDGSAPGGQSPDVVIGDSIVFAADGGGGGGVAPTVSVTGDNVVDVTTNAADTAELTASDSTGDPAATFAWDLKDSGGAWQSQGAGSTLTVDAALLNSLGYATPMAGDPATLVDYQVTGSNGVAPDSVAGGQIEFIPEPSSIMMLLTGLVGLTLSWWRRR